MDRPGGYWPDLRRRQGALRIADVSNPPPPHRSIFQARPPRWARRHRGLGASDRALVFRSRRSCCNSEPTWSSPPGRRTGSRSPAKGLVCQYSKNVVPVACNVRELSPKSRRPLRRDSRPVRQGGLRREQRRGTVSVACRSDLRKGLACRHRHQPHRDLEHVKPPRRSGSPVTAARSSRSSRTCGAAFRA